MITKYPQIPFTNYSNCVGKVFMQLTYGVELQPNHFLLYPKLHETIKLKYVKDLNYNFLIDKNVSLNSYPKQWIDNNQLSSFDSLIIIENKVFYNINWAKL